MDRNEVYGYLVWAGQLRYLDAIEGQTDQRAKRQARLLAMLLKRWQRGF